MGTKSWDLASDYIQRGRKEHLGNESNYRTLTKEGALNRQRGLQIKLRYFIFKYGPRDSHQEPPDYVCISKVENTFLRRALNKYPDRLARVWMTAKVHKTP